MEPIATIVGYVRKPSDGVIYLDILEEFWDATLEIDQFSHLIVLWWIDGWDTPQGRSNLQDHPPQSDAKLSGIFASRSPGRPTPIGLSIVALLEVDEKNHRLVIDQIDARDGTPFVDIKPYMPTSDRVDDAKVPSWFKDNVPRYTS